MAELVRSVHLFWRVILHCRPGVDGVVAVHVVGLCMCVHVAVHHHVAGFVVVAVAAVTSLVDIYTNNRVLILYICRG